MPDTKALGYMYGPDYQARDQPADPNDLADVIGWLGNRAAGTLVDYGCGAGQLLSLAHSIGWRVLGIEFDVRVVADLARRLELPVLAAGSQEAAAWNGLADVLFLGDVIEHLTDMDRELGDAVRLLRPGGILLAQGPLENNPTLFRSVVSLSRRLRGSPSFEMAPYHVVQATAAGQRTLFARHGFEELEFHLQEVCWPAPERLTVADWCSPRRVALFALRRVSLAASALNPTRWGNRYLYAGRLTRQPAASALS